MQIAKRQRSFLTIIKVGKKEMKNSRELKNQEKLNQAIVAYQSGKLKTALPIFEDLYDQLDNPELIIDYADNLYQLKRYTQASKVAQNDIGLFVEKAPELFVKIMLVTDRPLDARLFITRLPETQAGKYKIMIEEAEAKMIKAKTASIREISRNFTHLGDYSFDEQETRFNLAPALPLKEYIQSAKFVLRDPYVNPLIKSSISNDLVILNVSEKMMIYWLDEQEHAFIPKEVKTFSDLPAVQEVFEQLKHAYSQNNPHSFEIYTETFNLQLLYLYPFAQEVITDPKAWFQALTSSKPKNIEKYQEAKHWQELIAKYISQFRK